MMASAVEANTEREPFKYRIARTTLAVYAKPDRGAGLRGRIPASHAFEVFAYVDGPQCDGLGWADVGNGGYVCLHRTRKAGDRRPRTLPKMRARGLTPFYYAKVLKGNIAHRWRSLASWGRNDPPTATLEADHDYAFTTRMRHRGRLVLMDSSRRVVPESQVTVYRPSRFQGRDLTIDPLESSQTLAWSISWPQSAAYRGPSSDAEPRSSLDYHAELVLEGEPIVNLQGTWYQLPDGGYVNGRHLRRWRAPSELPSGVGPDEVWIDVSLGQQTLAVMRGRAPIFVTLVSTGLKAPTPRGLFRIRLKQAVGSMSSSPGADEPYNVEAVPFVQYFRGSYALHGAYWHNRFGHRVSHGCVNLSPKDARQVFSLTSPRPRDGWVHAYETDNDFGTTVRIRRGHETVPDRRKPVEPVYLNRRSSGEPKE